MRVRHSEFRYSGSMTEDTDQLLDATTALIPPLLTALDALAYAGRHLHQPALGEVVGAVNQFQAPLKEGADIVTGSTHDVWEVNVEAEYHEEVSAPNPDGPTQP